MKKILLIGDIADDVLIQVKVSRICPEAPVPIAVPVYVSKSDGMVGNVLRNFMSLTALHSSNFVMDAPNRRSIKTRYVDMTSGYLMFRVDEDVHDEWFNYSHIEQLLNPDITSAVVIADYNKGYLTTQEMRRLLEKCHLERIPTFLDTKKILGDWSRRAFCVKINEKEFEDNVVGLETSMPYWYCSNLIVTHSDSPTTCYLGCPTEKIVDVEVPKVNAVDVCGAGDTMMAALVLKYLKSGDLVDAVKYANQVASFSTTKRGVYAVTQEDLVANKLEIV